MLVQNEQARIQGKNQEYKTLMKIYKQESMLSRPLKIRQIVEQFSNHKRLEIRLG